MDQFRNVGLVGRMGSLRVVETLKRLIKFLGSRDCGVILEEATAELIPGHQSQTSGSKLLGETCDLVIVVGGDGSLLGVARALAGSNVPVLGVNRGRLGFLTDITPTEIEVQVGDVLTGKYLEESRFLLDVFVKRNGDPIGYGSALNDVVLHPGRSTRMISFDLYVEGQFVHSQRADGLIVATPTGSTAYALSAGGPIMHPRLDAVVLVPMFPHSLSNRPIVVDGSSEIKVMIDERNEIYPQVSCDGQSHIATAPGDSVTIGKKPQKLRLIHPINHNFYQICRDKLGWSGSRTRGS